MSESYRLLRETLSVRRTFFNDVKALTRYLVFEGRVRHQDRQARQEEALKLVCAERQVLPRLGRRNITCIGSASKPSKSGAMFGLLRDQDLLIAQKRSKRRTTDSRDGLLTYENLIKDHHSDRGVCSHA